MSGTSMASPYVAGVIGLMLAVNPQLTGAQVGGIVKRSARPLPGADYTWRDDAGSGVIDPESCIAEADAMLDQRDVT
jgi:subtilisin family serine protease